MKKLTILIVAVSFLPIVKCFASESTIPPEIEKQFDPNVLNGTRPKTVILMQSMILGLRDQPKLDADIVTIGFDYRGLSPAQRGVLENWFRTGSNKVYFDLAPSNIYDTISNRATSPKPIDIIVRMFKCQISWVNDKSLMKHVVNTGCKGLRLGYFHNPRGTWGMKEGEVVEVSGFPSEGSEVIIKGKDGMVAGKFVYGKTECFYLGAALGGPAKFRWEKNFWQWALGLKVPGAADTGAGGGAQVADAQTTRLDESALKNGDKLTGKVLNEAFVIKLP
jgi:hypothetical protein